LPEGIYLYFVLFLIYLSRLTRSYISFDASYRSASNDSRIAVIGSN